MSWCEMQRMQRLGLDAEIRVGCRRMIRCGDPLMKTDERERINGKRVLWY